MAVSLHAAWANTAALRAAGIDAQTPDPPKGVFLRDASGQPTGVILEEAMKVFDHSNGHDALLLLPGESTASSLEDLKGQTFCYPDPKSTSGFVLPTFRMREAGLDPTTDFVMRESGNHHQVLRDLVEGTCQLGATYAGALRTADEVGIQISLLRTLLITGRTPHDAIVSYNVDAKEREAMRQALLSFDPSEVVDSARLGEMERVTGFEPIDDSRYDELREVVGLSRE